MRSKPRRGLQDIRSMTDLVSETKNPQRKYLKLAVLEMEKVRRGKEKTSARERAEDMDKRLAEIEVEQTQLLKLVEAARQGQTPAADVSAPARCVAPKARHGFILKY